MHRTVRALRFRVVLPTPLYRTLSPELVQAPAVYASRAHITYDPYSASCTNTEELSQSDPSGASATTVGQAVSENSYAIMCGNMKRDLNVTFRPLCHRTPLQVNFEKEPDSAAPATQTEDTTAVASETAKPKRRRRKTRTEQSAALTEGNAARSEEVHAVEVAADTDIGHVPQAKEPQTPRKRAPRRKKNASVDETNSAASPGRPGVDLASTATTAPTPSCPSDPTVPAAQGTPKRQRRPKKASSGDAATPPTTNASAAGQRKRGKKAVEATDASENEVKAQGALSAPPGVSATAAEVEPQPLGEAEGQSVGGEVAALAGAEPAVTPTEEAKSKEAVDSAMRPGTFEDSCVTTEVPVQSTTGCEGLRAALAPSPSEEREHTKGKGEEGVAHTVSETSSVPPPPPPTTTDGEAVSSTCGPRIEAVHDALSAPSSPPPLWRKEDQLPQIISPVLSSSSLCLAHPPPSSESTVPGRPDLTSVPAQPAVPFENFVMPSAEEALALLRKPSRPPPSSASRSSPSSQAGSRGTAAFSSPSSPTTTKTYSKTPAAHPYSWSAAATDVPRTPFHHAAAKKGQKGYSSSPPSSHHFGEGGFAFGTGTPSTPHAPQTDSRGWPAQPSQWRQ